MSQVLRQWLQDDAFTRVMRNAGVLLQGQLAAALLGILALALAARHLGPEPFGQLVLIITSIALIDRIGNPQSWQAIVRYGAEAHQKGNPALLLGLLAWCLRLEIGTALLRGALAFGSATLAAQWFGWPEETVRQAQLYSLVFLFYTGEMGTGMLRLYDRFALMAWIQGIVALVRLIAVVWAVLCNAEAGAFLLIWAVCDVMQRLWVGLQGWWSVRQAEVLPAFEWRFLSLPTEHFPYLWRFVASTAGVAVLRSGTRELDTVIVGAVLGPTAVAFFHLSKKAGTAISRIAEPLTQSVYPDFVRGTVRGENAQMLGLFTRASLVTGAIGFTGWFCFLLIGQPLLVAVLGEGYRGAFPVMALYLAGTALALMSALMQPALVALGRPDLSMKVLLVATKVYVCLLWGGVIEWGLVAAGAAYVVFYSLWSGLMYAAIMRVMRGEAT